MSEIRQRLDESPEQSIDRLVDGELSPAERRELLAALEDEPGGWRRCALAFVEASVWRDAFHDVQVEGTVLPRIEVVGPGRQRQQSWAWSYAFALAACVLVAFVVGRYAASGSSERELAANARRSNDGEQAVKADDFRQDHLDDNLQENMPNRDSSSQSKSAWQTVQLDLDDALAGESQAVDVPCLDVSNADPAQIDPAWTAKQQSAVTEQLMETLRETGHVVTTEMQWWPVEMADGRRVILPVEQVEVRYLGGEL